GARKAGLVAEVVTAYRAGVQERLRAVEVERAAVRAREAERRKRRRLWLGLAAAGVLLAGGGLWVLRDRADRARAEALRLAEAKRGLDAALTQAHALVRAGRRAEARASVRRAEGLAHGDPRPGLRARVLQAQRDLDLVAA